MFCCEIGLPKTLFEFEQHGVLAAVKFSLTVKAKAEPASKKTELRSVVVLVKPPHLKKDQATARVR